ncbi:MAG TPA: GWxTD domain-containing protein, partial [Bacteroidales bacterium]
TDTTKADGLLLTNPGPGFPKVNEPEMMIPPLEYLTTTDEFNTLKKIDNNKLAIDNFWLKSGGSVDMAREMIRIYYNRMFYANLFFTSYKQGWKTDRGMIYMVFGPPSYMTKDALSETWEYYVKQDASNLTITFTKTPSPYSENHYVMQRSDAFTRFWRNAIDSWRKGKAYSLEE